MARLAFEELDPVTGHHRIWSFDAGPDRNVWGLTAHVLKVLLERTFPGGAWGTPGQRSG